MKKLFVICYLLSTVCLTAFSQDYRDVVYLKNGSVLKGFFLEYVQGDTLHMDTFDGSHVNIAPSDIQRIAKEKTDVYVIHQSTIAETKVWRPRGYRGFIEYAYGMDLGKHVYYTNGTSQTLSTFHGYQFNPHWFLGLGLQSETYKAVLNGYTIQPVSATFSVLGNARWYITHTRIAPYLDARGGYAFTGYKGPLLSGGGGVDFGISPRAGVSVGVYYQVLYCVVENGPRSWANYLNFRVAVHF